ncbi:metallophosphoesterase [Micractinium conductrix]|uniref:Metallophosphoesterase n=1 Tax=Micractinium conductrix TaxID=554055 RepID=A0A2P6V1B1_9CHLO|nr:metallophosphoesterase [Micractinium conductrix]|eukprot:PSC67882.1 metallophosphoesterase [Micractinium conductrix]
MCAQLRLGTPLGPRLLPPPHTAWSSIRRPRCPPRAQQQQPELQQAAVLPQLRRPPVRRPPPPSPAAEQRARMTAAHRAAAAAASAAQQRGRTIRLAVIGDVHSQWGADSAAALEFLGADVAVFVGDFGEEDVALIRSVAALPHPKAVMLGNHDAWFSLTPRGRQRYLRALAAGTTLAARGGHAAGGGDKGSGSTPAIAAQLDALGGDHVGYASKRFPALGLTLLGGRPFSKGGRQWSDIADFYAEQYGVGGHRDSALRMLDVALSAPEEDVKVLVAHNGPTGLGARRHSICGVDWMEPEADHGDPDLQEALEMMAAQGLHLPLVLFGHMHSQLKGSGMRNRAEVHPQTGTLYLNAAVVPRIRPLPVPPPDGEHGGGGASGNGSSGGSSGGGGQGATIRSHHFTVVEMRQGVVAAARDVWVGVQRCDAGGGGKGSGGGGAERRCMVVRQQELVKTSLAAAAAHAAAGAAGNGGSGNGNGTAAAAAAAAPGREAAEEAAAAAEAAEAAAAAEGGYVCSVFRAHTGEWEPFVLQLPAAAAAAEAAAQLAA